MENPLFQRETGTSITGGAIWRIRPKIERGSSCFSLSGDGYDGISRIASDERRLGERLAKRRRKIKENDVMKVWACCGVSLLMLTFVTSGSGDVVDGPLFGPVIVEPNYAVPDSPLLPRPAPIPSIVTDESVIVRSNRVGEPVLQPIPEQMIVPDSSPVPLFTGCDLFPCVKYKNPKKVAPCAVEMIVAVRTPLGCKKDACKPCVLVKICVPPCSDCPKVKIRKAGDKVFYDYGKYAVELTSKKGEVVVAYHKGLF